MSAQNDNALGGLVCSGVQPGFACHFDGACYGEICIAPNLCRKNREELTAEERGQIAAVIREAGL